MSPNEIIVRWFVNWACGWLASHGMPGFDDNNIIVAVTTDIVAYGVPFLLLARALYTRSAKHIADWLAAHHPLKLLETAAEVPGVEKIIATPDVAAATPSEKVVPPTQV